MESYFHISARAGCTIKEAFTKSQFKVKKKTLQIPILGVYYKSSVGDTEHGNVGIPSSIYSPGGFL